MKTRLPKLCRHRAKNRAYVRLNGVQHYLGDWGTPETEAAYKRVIADFLTTPASITTRNNPTLADVAYDYEKHVEGAYTSGTLKSQVWLVLGVRRGLQALWPDNMPAKDFSPKCLRTLMNHWVTEGVSRYTVNKRRAELIRMFKWAASHELVGPEVPGALRNVDPLERGKGGKEEPEPIGPVAIEHVEAVKPHLPPALRDVVDLMLLTGARPGEMLALTPADIEQEGDLLVARLKEHKTKHHGRQRALYFGTKAQAILKPYLLRPKDAYLFSPREAMRQRAAEAPTHRRPDQKDDPRETSRRVKDCYATSGLRKAIERVCEQHDIPRWHPNQLRHTAATRIRKEHGLEAAQVLLGHATADITQIYAERDAELAKRVAREIG